MEPKRTVSIYPSVAEIDAMPRSSASTFMIWKHAATRVAMCRPSQSCARIGMHCRKRVEELEACIALQEREYLEARIETD
jgi:hypothetical protein